MNYGILSFLMTVLIINIAPGPAMLFVLNQSVKHGVKNGIKAAAGVELGVFFYVLCAAFGLVVLFQQFPTLYRVVQVCGALYLLWLAWLSWPRSRKEGNGSVAEKEIKPAKHTFGKGILINLTNPKIGIFFISLLPQFVPTGDSPTWLYFLLYGLVFNIGGILVNTMVGIMAFNLKSVIQQNSWFDYVPPILFVLISFIAIGRQFV